MTDTALKLAPPSSQKLAHRRYLALWFPFLPTDRILRKEAGDRRDRPAFALVEKSHGALVLAACDPKAVELGLTPGLSLADARARYPQLETAEAQRDADEQAIAFIAAFCDRFTPLVALDPPHGLVLDLTGCAHLFGGEAALLDSLHRRFQEIWHLQVRSAIAGRRKPPALWPGSGVAAFMRPGKRRLRRVRCHWRLWKHRRKRRWPCRAQASKHWAISPPGRPFWCPPGSVRP